MGKSERPAPTREIYHRSPSMTSVTADIASANAAAALTTFHMYQNTNLSSNIDNFLLPNGLKLGQLGGELTELFGDSTPCADKRTNCDVTRPKSSPSKLTNPQRWATIDEDASPKSYESASPQSMVLSPMTRRLLTEPKLSGSQNPVRRKLSFDAERATMTKQHSESEVGRSSIRLGRVADERGMVLPRAKPMRLASGSIGSSQSGSAGASPASQATAKKANKERRAIDGLVHAFDLRTGFY